MSKTIKHRAILTMPLDTLAALLRGADGKSVFQYHPEGGSLTHGLLTRCKITHVSVDHNRDCIDILLDTSGALPELSGHENRCGSWPRFYHGYISADKVTE